MRYRYHAIALAFLAVAVIRLLFGSDIIGRLAVHAGAGHW